MDYLASRLMAKAFFESIFPVIDNMLCVGQVSRLLAIYTAFPTTLYKSTTLGSLS